MAAKTPSKGIDQNGDGKFVDKYWGRVPQFSKYIPAAYICDVNPEYIDLMDGLIDGSVSYDNVSQDLRIEIEFLLLNMDCPCILDGKQRLLIDAYNSGDMSPCSVPSHLLDCAAILCCDELLLCEAITVCEE